ncbi:MAG: cobyrinate a,c-diamide synthase [Clostridiaceae bacterium]|nr:cobyrinate a,c-diamide synthase [Clostridiaceae bacterium]
MTIRKVTIAGTNSGCGKTTVTMGILATLYVMGLDVQPFMVGHDYITTMIHSFITGNDSRNLDSWMLDIDTVVHLFEKNAVNADISVIEGANGLYDGVGENTIVGSTAHVSKIVKAPVILVVNAEGLSLSIVPMINGYTDYDKNLEIIGVILNKVESEAHYESLKVAIENGSGLKVFGYLPKMEDLPCSHLGLVPQEEIIDLKKKIRLLVEQVIQTIDVDLIIKMSNRPKVSYLNATKFLFKSKPENTTKIAVARDKAFNYYYKDNINLLEIMGAEISYFSPLVDELLPKDVDGLYFGGGCLDFYLKELQENKTLLKDINRKISEGLPTYAEGDSLMYLCEYVEHQENENYIMAGVLNGYCDIPEEANKSGYVDIEVIKDNVLSNKGCRIRGHELHRSSIHMLSKDILHCFMIQKKCNEMESITWKGGFSVHNMLASYQQIHFWSNTNFAAKFIDNCIKHKTKEIQVI